MVRTFQLDENTINDKSQTGYEVTEKIADCLKIADSYIEDAYEEINRHSDLRYVEYNSLSSDITKIENYSRDYYNFRKFTNEYDDNVDSIFFKYQEDAMKYLSSIRLQDIQIDNNLGITEKYTHPYRTDMPVQDIPKAKLNIDNLLSYEEVDDALREQYKEQQEMIKKLKELAALKEEEWPEGITKEQKEQIKVYLNSLNKSGEDQESYDDQIKRLLKEGEFEFETKNEQRLTTVLNCIPVVGDIKGIAEVIAGKDLVSGRKLSDLEKGINLVASVVGLSQIGKVAGVPAKIAAKESAKAGVKEVLKDGMKYTLKETTKNLVMVEAFDELSKIGVDLGVGPKTQLAIMAGLLYGHGKLKSKLSGNTVGNVLEDAKNVDEIKTIVKDAGDMKNVDDEIKAAVKDAGISKTSEELGQVVKDENIDRNIVEDAAVASKSGIIGNIAKDATVVKNIKDEVKAVADGENISTVSKDIEKEVKNSNINNNINENVPPVSRGEYLRNKFKDKYGIELTSQDINNRINLRGVVKDALDKRLAEAEKEIADRISKLSKNKIKKGIEPGRIRNEVYKEIGPAIAGSMDPRTGEISIKFNNSEGNVPKKEDLNHKFDFRLDTIRKDMDDDYYTHTIKDGNGKQGGSHAEIYAVNERLNNALKNGKESEMSDLLLYVLQTGLDKRRLGTPGLPFARCPHCEYLTDSIKYFPECLWYGKAEGRKYGEYRKK